MSRLVLVGIFGAVGAVLVALERDDIGAGALGEVALALRLVDGAELAFPVAPDAADAPPDEEADGDEDEDAEDRSGHVRARCGTIGPGPLGLRWRRPRAKNRAAARRRGRAWVRAA